LGSVQAIWHTTFKQVPLTSLVVADQSYECCLFLAHEQSNWQTTEVITHPAGTKQ